MNRIPNPQRVQRRRTKGYRMPNDTIYVGRPGRYGNMFVIGQIIGPVYDCETIMTRGQAVFLFSNKKRREEHNYPNDEEIRKELRGYNLACWCSLTVPCHADILLQIAND